MMASEVLISVENPRFTQEQPAKRVPKLPPMMKELQIRTAAVLLAFLTLAAIIFAWLNFQQERLVAVPTDGVWWVESGDHLVARRVHPQSPGERAGIKSGDVLLTIDEQQIVSSGKLTRQLQRKGVYADLKYVVERAGVELPVQVVVIPEDNSLHNGLRIIALIYLAIGLYVLLRRWSAPKSTHFYIFCLVSFILYSFHYTGKFNAFDWSIYWSNIVASMLQPALFLHFSLTFPEKKAIINRGRWVEPLIYLPGAFLLGIYLFSIETLPATNLLLFRLEQMQWFYLAAYFAIAAGVLWHSYTHANTPILRQQMKWVTRGTLLAIAPFTFFYVLPYLQGELPTTAMKFSVLSLVFLPLTLGYAIVRWRLMDVDIIFKRGMIYTLATASIVGAYFGIASLIAQTIQKQLPIGNIGLVIAIIVTALLFDPVKHAIQERLDRVFYRKRYDYRRTLIEFGRELSAEKDLSTMLTSVVDRLSRTLLVDRIGIFLSKQEEASNNFFLAKSFGIAYSGELDLSFLGVQRSEQEAGHLFFDNTNQAVR